MESRIIQLTAAAHRHGNLNIGLCGKDFFPPDVFGGSSRAKGLGVPITLRVQGLSGPVETDIPTDNKTQKPRWIFRDRAWVKKFLSSNNLVAGDTITINRVDKRTYEVTPNNDKPHLPDPKTSKDVYYKTNLGQIYLGDSLKILRKVVTPASVDLIVTSPPFGLVRKKNYGNVDADKYVECLRPFRTL